MMDALIAFARSGDPSAEGRPHWPRFDLERRATLIFDDRIRVEDDPRGRERRLFEPVPYLQPGT
jgi:para-nitrobenzyl esterase